ncbi:MAG: radical SAM protein [Ignavibacteria bacterium]|nr:radical SAM protein [Ignavibacteria bacterium]
MIVKAKTGNDSLAAVYIAEMQDGGMIEFVESLQPPFTINEKWVLIISTLCGCPVECSFCDAGGNYRRRLTEEEMFSQIDYMVSKRYPDRVIPADKFKIQFSRVGEPSFNPDVIDVLRNFSKKFTAKNFIPSVSTIAPSGTEKFFQKLLEVKKELYDKSFQLQFSIHSTDTAERDKIIPVKKWSFPGIARYSEKFFSREGKKITLNFVLTEPGKFDTKILKKYFPPEIFLIKFTPLNPTFKAVKNKLQSYIQKDISEYEIAKQVTNEGYEIIISVGEYEENLIGSNCGQYVAASEQNNGMNLDGYTYKVKKL